MKALVSRNCMRNIVRRQRLPRHEEFFKVYNEKHEIQPLVGTLLTKGLKVDRCNPNSNLWNKFLLFYWVALNLCESSFQVESAGRMVAKPYEHLLQVF